MSSLCRLVQDRLQVVLSGLGRYLAIPVPVRICVVIKGSARAARSRSQGALAHLSVCQSQRVCRTRPADFLDQRSTNPIAAQLLRPSGRRTRYPILSPVAAAYHPPRDLDPIETTEHPSRPDRGQPCRSPPPPPATTASSSSRAPRRPAIWASHSPPSAVGPTRGMWAAPGRPA